MSAIFVEKPLLSDDVVRAALDEVKKSENFPVFPLEDWNDIKRAELDNKYFQDNQTICDMFLLIVLQDFETDLFHNILKKFKSRKPKVKKFDKNFFFRPS